MALVVRRIFFLAVVVLSLNACSSEPEKQWYKPGRNYTVAEFQRDQAECTKNKALDEECMKERGWIAISADTYSVPPMKGGLQDSGKPGRYAPK
jgi:hypothetical protein